MHGTYARAPHKRTSLEAPPRAVERLVAGGAVVAARPGPRAVVPRPSGGEGGEDRATCEGRRGFRLARSWSWGGWAAGALSSSAGGGGAPSHSDKTRPWLRMMVEMLEVELVPEKSGTSAI